LHGRLRDVLRHREFHAMARRVQPALQHIEERRLARQRSQGLSRGLRLGRLREFSSGDGVLGMAAHRQKLPRDLGDRTIIEAWSSSRWLTWAGPGDYEGQEHERRE